MLDIDKSVAGENIDLPKLSRVLRKRKGIVGYGEDDTTLTKIADMSNLLKDEATSSPAGKLLPTSTSPGLVERSVVGTSGLLSPPYMKSGEIGVRLANEMSPYSNEVGRRIMGLFGAGMLNDPSN